MQEEDRESEAQKAQFISATYTYWGNSANSYIQKVRVIENGVGVTYGFNNNAANRLACGMDFVRWASAGTENRLSLRMQNVSGWISRASFGRPQFG